jgi:Transposase DDE domain
MVEELDRKQDSEQESNARREKARQRAARERLERMQLAAEELKKMRASKGSEQERQEARVSLTEPEARWMKHGNNAIAPGYNVQLSTDAENKVIVGMHVTQCGSDSGSLLPAMEEVKETAGRYPKQAVADGGFTNQASIVGMQDKQIEFYGSLSETQVRQAAAMKAAGIDPAFAPAWFKMHAENGTLQCPAGKMLVYVRQSRKRDETYYQYQAQASDCGCCEFQKQCCPKHPDQGRLVSIRMAENADVAAFREKMKTEEAKQIYKQRGPVAEFPNCWIKEKLGLRKFRLPGLGKATTEALWGVLTYDVMQWVRLSWRPKLSTAMAAYS